MQVELYLANGEKVIKCDSYTYNSTTHEFCVLEESIVQVRRWGLISEKKKYRTIGVFCEVLGFREIN